MMRTDDDDASFGFGTEAYLEPGVQGGEAYLEPGVQVDVPLDNGEYAEPDDGYAEPDEGYADPDDGLKETDF